MSHGVDLGLLVLRLGLAALLFGHAGQKLFGWFQGMGPAGHGAVFHQWGFRPGVAMAVVAGVCELTGAGSLALGLLTPGGCAVVIGTMIVAASANIAKGLWAHLGGSEVPIVYAGLAVVIAITGPGDWSVDHALGLDGLRSWGWTVAAIALGVVAAAPPILRRRNVLRHLQAPA